MTAMVRDGESSGKRSIKNSLIAIVLASASILLVPLVAMQFTDEVAWSPGDFAVAAALLVGTGFLYVIATRKMINLRQRVVVGAALAAAFLLVWAELAVGII